ncbi:MAG: glycoside hydrolase family 127 protein [Acidobacteriaceae bacterium]
MQGVGGVVAAGALGQAFGGSRPQTRRVQQNRAPLAQNALLPLPLGAISPTGWLRQQLRIQADGLTGHLEEVWPDVGANSGWLGGTGESWERGPYYLDGLIPLAYLLDDAVLKNKAQKWMEWTLNHQQANGLIGPPSNDDWWPRMVMLKVLTQYHEATGDTRVIPVMQRYCAYQFAHLPTRPLRDWGHFRWQDNAVSVLWLYNQTGDPKLLDLVRLLHQQGYDWGAGFQRFQFTRKMDKQSLGLDKDDTKDNALAMMSHGVNNAMGFKHSPLTYLISNDDRDRAGLSAQLALLDRYHGHPNGMFSCDEHFAGTDPSQGSELCSVVEAMYSLEYAIGVLGDSALGDRLERLAFNALPAALTDDMWAHQYDQQPNQIRVDVNARQWSTNGPDSNLFGLEPNFGCCTANFHQGWPKFAQSTWMATPDGGLAAVIFSPSEVSTTVATGVPVVVRTETEYPFRGEIRMEVDPEKPTAFPLLVRVPSWAGSADIRVNGSSVDAAAPNGFVRIQRIWRSGDHVQVKLPMQVRTSRWHNQSVAFERGPLVFSYPVAGEWRKVKERGKASDWSIEPRSTWNFGVNPRDVQVRELDRRGGAFTQGGIRVNLTVDAQQAPEWKEVEHSAGPLPSAAVRGEGAVSRLTLVPYGAARLRVTAFPELVRG